MFRQQDGEIPVLLIYPTRERHVPHQEESDGDTPRDHSTIGHIHLRVDVVIFEELIAEPADVDQSEHEGGADNAVNAPLGAALSEESSHAEPGFDVPNLAETEVRDLRLGGLPRGGDVRKQLGCQEPPLECSLPHCEKNEEGDRQYQPHRRRGEENDGVEIIF